MFFGSSAQDEAERSIGAMRALAEQQEYEFQRQIADLHLRLLRLQHLVGMRKITDDAVGELEAAVTNLKHDLRNACGCVDEAIERLQELEDSLVVLEMQE